MNKSERSNRQSLLLVLGVAIVLLIGYFFWNSTQVTTPNSSTDMSNGQVSSTPASLTGATWVWQMTQMNNDDVIQPNAEGVFTLTFTEDGQVFGTTDCNNFRGSYTVGDDNMLTFTPFASTLMFCDGSQEAEFTQIVSNSDSFMFDAGGNLVLMLKFDSGSSIFTPQPLNTP